MLKLVLLFACVVPATAEGFRRVCYYANWAQYRPVTARMTPEKIDTKLCTHLIYAFAKLDFKFEINFTEWNDPQLVKEFNGLKEENRDLRTLLSVGGYNQGPRLLSDLAADKNLREKFARRAVQFLQHWKFDGLDLSWEFPGANEGRKTDKNNFISLLKALREEFNKAGRKLLLTAAVPSKKSDIDKGYDIFKIAGYVDFVNLMSYDIHGHWDRKAEHNSPLYPRKSEKGNARTLNVDWAAKYLVSKGLPKAKLNIGLATYGRHFELSKVKKSGIGSKIKRAGTKGPYTKEDGFLAYFEICELEEDGKRKWVKEQKVPYLLHNKHWIGYDDDDSFLIKLNYIKENGYGGASVWSLDMDDFDKQCPHSTQAFPLVKKMAEVLGEYKPDDQIEYEEVEEDWEESTTNTNSDGNEYKRVCYFTNWAQYRSDFAKFKVSDVDPFLCTHLIYSFADLQNYQLATREWNDEEMYTEFNTLKAENPALKTLIAIGGWNAGSEIFSNMVANAPRREHFAREAVKFLRQWNFDGLDLDWEYPAKRGGVPADKTNFITWIKDIRREFDNDPQSPKLLLTAAVGAGKDKIENSYDIPEMNKYLDFINLMTYDLHGHWDGYVGHNSPLYSRTSESTAEKRLNTAWAAETYVQKGLSKDKLIIGIPLYGRSFTLADRNRHNFGDATTGPGPKGPYVKAEGFLAYFEVCQKLSSGEGTRQWHNEHKVPYVVNGEEWIGYDDKDSIALKLDYIKSNGYGGAMVWALDLDDFNGKLCTSSQEAYPLMNLIKRDLEDNTVSEDRTAGAGAGNGYTDSVGNNYGGGNNAETSNDNTYTVVNNEKPEDTDVQVQPVNPPAQGPQQTSVNPNNLCAGKSSGYYAYPTDCSKFYICSHNKAYVQSCAAGLYWNPRITNCDWSYNVDCKVKRSVENASNPLERTLLKLLQKYDLKKQNSDMSEQEQKSLESPHPDKPKLDQHDSRMAVFDGEGLDTGDTDVVGMPYLPSRNTDWLETSERAEFYTAGHEARENNDDNDDDDARDEGDDNEEDKDDSDEGEDNEEDEDDGDEGDDNEEDMDDRDEGDDDEDDEYESIDEEYIF